MKKTLLAGFAAVVLSAGAAHASMTLVAGPGGLSVGTIPSDGDNNGLIELFGQTAPGSGFGYFGATVTGDAGNYLIEYFGAEASNRNQFTFNGSSLFTTPGIDGTGVWGADDNTPLLSAGVVHGGGMLNFSFLVRNAAGNPIPANPDVVNGANPNDLTTNLPNFFASFAPTTNPGAGGGPTTGDVLWLFLDDGNQVDDNHDDMVIRITFQGTPVPEPATLGLLGAGLLGLGFAARRRKSA